MNNISTTILLNSIYFSYVNLQPSEAQQICSTYDSIHHLICETVEKRLEAVIFERLL